MKKACDDEETRHGKSADLIEDLPRPSRWRIVGRGRMKADDGDDPETLDRVQTVEA